MKIVLTGFMGSGKSTLGRRLARFMNYPFYDLDQEISREEGYSVKELFDLRGESGFRQMEEKYLGKLMEHKDVVISLGGGTACIPGVMDNLLKHSVVIYLNMKVEDLATRLRRSPVQRPLLEGMTEADLTNYIRKKLGERDRVYSRAHISIDGENPNLPLLVKALEKYKTDT